MTVKLGPLLFENVSLEEAFQVINAYLKIPRPEPHNIMPEFAAEWCDSQRTIIEP